MKVELKEKDNCWELKIKDFYLENEAGKKMDEDLSNHEMEALYNKLLQLSRGARPKTIGCISEIFENYVEKCKRKKIEVSVNNWKSYYLKNYKPKYLKGKEMFRKYVIDIKKKELAAYGIELSELNIEKITNKVDEYYDNLIFVKTCFGLYAEKSFGEAIVKLGHKWVKNYDEESRGIDGWINNKIPVSVKPYSFNEKSDYVPVTINNMAVYSKKGNDLVFSLNFSLNAK